MDARLAKTDAGREELRERKLSLSRPARLLLLIIDASRSGADWVASVKGCSLQDLQQLLDAGLLVPQAAAPARAAAAASAAGATPAAMAAAAKSPAPVDEAQLGGRIDQLGYRVLYDLITAQARPRLGLIKGYRMVLEVERCNGTDEIRALARRFATQVREAQGSDGLRELDLLLRPAVEATST